MEKPQNDALRILQEILDQEALQTRILRTLERSTEVDNCLLDAIARATCQIANEVHANRSELAAMRSSLDQLLALYRTTHPEAALRYDELAKLRSELEACCPPAKAVDPICTYTPCLPVTEGFQEGGWSVKSRGSVERVAIGKRPHPGWKIVDEPHHEEDDLLRIVPQGPFVAQLIPSSQTGEVRNYLSGGSSTPDGQEPVTFRQFTGTTLSAGWPPDCSGAKAGEVVLMSGNLWLKLSVDGGATFTDLDFTKLFAADTVYGGWAGDQVLHYIPSIDCFALYVQSFKKKSGSKKNQNVIKIAIASPADLKTYSGGRDAWWRQWDFVPETFDLGASWMDFPDLSYGDDYLFVNTNVFAGKSGKLFYELPLSDMKAGDGLSFYYAFIDDDVTVGSPIQNIGGNSNYFAGHVNNASMRIYKSVGGAPDYSWRDRSLANWPITSDNNIISKAPDFPDWISEDHRIIGATRRRNELWFAWTATKGDGGNGGFKFPQPHIQIAKFDLNDNYKLIEQTQVWNADIAFAYPSLTTNSDNEVGISLAWGGGSYYGSHAVGILGDFVVWYGEASQETSTRQKYDDSGNPLTNPDGTPVLYSRWGDYVHVRLAQPDSRFFSGFGYAVETNPGATPPERMNFLYVEFGRERRVGRPPG